MRILVCGGRDYADYAKVDSILDTLKPTHIIQGGASGADSLAWDYAYVNNLPCTRYPALWKVQGKAAGPIRNQRMLDEGKPDLVIAFPGGAGTADMVRRARKAGVEVRVVEA